MTNATSKFSRSRFNQVKSKGFLYYFYMVSIITPLLFSFQALSCFNSSSVIDHLCLQAPSESIAERLKEKIMPFIPRVINECFSSHLSAIDPSSHQVASDQLVITSVESDQ